MLLDSTQSFGDHDGGTFRIGSDRDVVSIVRGDTPHPLALPRFNDTVSPKFNDLDDKSRWAKLALGFMDAGFISAKAKVVPAYELVQSAAQRWVSKYCKGLQYLNLSLTVTCSIECIHWGNPYAYDEPPPDQNFLLIAGGGGYPKKEIGTVLEAFEAEIPGLGETILAIIDGFGWRLSVMPLIPSTLKAFACHLLWGGMDTEEEWREYVADDQGLEDGDELPEGPGIMDENFQAWVLNPRVKLELADLRKLADRNDVVGKAARVAVRLWRYRGLEFGSLRGTDLDPAVLTCYLRWKSDDEMPRIVDDLDHILNQIETSSEILGIDYIPMSEEGFTKWITNSTKALKAIKLLDELLGLISIPFKELSNGQ